MRMTCAVVCFACTPARRGCHRERIAPGRPTPNSCSHVPSTDQPHRRRRQKFIRTNGQNPYPGTGRVVPMLSGIRDTNPGSSSPGSLCPLARSW